MILLIAGLPDGQRRRDLAQKSFHQRRQIDHLRSRQHDMGRLRPPRTGLAGDPWIGIDMIGFLHIRSGMEKA